MASQTELEFVEFDSSSRWTEVFQKLKSEATNASVDEDFTIKRAREPDNQHKNRYKDVSPYDHSRVILAGTNDYINASLIEVPEANRKYILTQGPLEHTMGDFWQMTWEQGTRAIVMLNKVVEKGSLKCSQYWPLGADYGYDQDMYFEDYGLRVTLIREHDYQDFTLRTLELEHMESGDKRDVFHFHYTTWPDFGVPSSPDAFLYFLHSVRETGSLEADVGPAIVHCSAGIGRSGTFCLVDSCLVMVKNSGTLKSVNIRKSLIQMRSFRMGLIQTADQLRFSYLAIIEGARAVLSGGGLGSLQVGHPSQNESDNHIEAPQPPERTTSLHPSNAVFLTPLNISTDPEESPPVLPPKKSPLSIRRDLSDFGEKVDVKIGEKDTGSGRSDDGSEELDNSPSRDEDNLDGRGDTEEEIRISELKHKIREDRKKQTLEKIRLMKEKQRKSERWRQYKPYLRRSVYFGLAFFVGVAAIVAYRYFL